MRKKKTPIQKLRDLLDAAWSLAVRHRDGNRCQMCGKTENLHAHHWFFRKARSAVTRWCLENGITLCYYCHMIQVHQYSDRAFMVELFKMLEKKFPQEVQDRMTESARGSVVWGIEEMTLRLSELRALVV